MSNSVMDNQRKSNIELLRVVIILGVFVLHYNSKIFGGALNFSKGYPTNHFLLLGFQSVFICAVNIFVIISGYCLCKSENRKNIKVIELVFQVICINLLYYFIRVALGKAQFSLIIFIKALLPCNYFVILYIVLYILHPYINVLFRQISKK